MVIMAPSEINYNNIATNFMINKSFTINLLVLLLSFYSNISFSNTHSFHFEKDINQHEKNPTITAVVPAFFPPFYYTDSEGIPYGMAIEVLNEIDHNAGYLSHFIVKKSWVDVFKAIDSAEAIVIPNLGITEERKKLYFFSKPYAKTDITVFTRPDNIIKTEAALTNLHIGVVKKNVGKKIALKRKYKNIHIFDSIELPLFIQN
jgi:ABC-type amino acid transport substrate-binding protein